MKTLRLMALLVLLVLVLAIPVLAQTYTADVSLQEIDGNSYSMYSALTRLDTDYLADKNLITATGLDTRVLEGTTELPHMLADNKLLFATDLPANSSKTLTLTLGNALLSAFNIITGRGGYITTTDNDTIEPSDNFTIGLGGVWVDTTAVGESLVIKPDAFEIYISATSNVTAKILEPDAQQQNYTTGDTGTDFISPATRWWAQTFTTNTTQELTSVKVRIYRSAGATGTLTVAVRATSGGDPTGSNLASGTYNIASLSTNVAGVWYDIPQSPAYNLETGTQYAVLLYSGDLSTFVNWRIDTTGAYGGGDSTLSTNSGSSWATAAGRDFMFEVWGMPLTEVTASGISSSENPIFASGNTTHFWIEVDGSIEDITALGGASIPDNANDWVWMSDTTPYSDNISITVNGTQALLYQPATYIVGNNLPDLAGTSQNGTITWGVNEDGTSVLVGSLYAVEGARAEAERDLTPGAVGTVAPPSDSMLFPSEVQMQGVGHVFYILLDWAATQTDIPIQWFWWFGVAIFTLAAMVATARYLPSLWWTAVVMIFGLGMGVAQTILPGWFIIVGAITLIGVIILERSPNV